MCEGEEFLKVEDEDDQGWSRGVKEGGVEGYYPANYVLPVEWHQLCDVTKGQGLCCVVLRLLWELSINTDNLCISVNLGSLLTSVNKHMLAASDNKQQTNLYVWFCGSLLV